MLLRWYMTEEQEKRIMVEHLFNMRNGYKHPENMEAPITEDETIELVRFINSLRGLMPKDAFIFRCPICTQLKWMTKEEHEAAIAQAKLTYTEEQILSNGGAIENMPLLCSNCFNKTSIKPLDN
jgi:hypothetical protein